jgi:thiamine biosynthesis lipoprotein
MRLDLGAIAKGYAVDEALDVLRERGITRALVSGGGDMAASEAPPGAKGWRIALSQLEESNGPAREFVLLRHRALATSGDLFQHVEIDGVRYSHIVDPRTGIGLTGPSLVIVIARDCTTADSLSTALSVLGTEPGLRLAEKKEACARVVRKPGSQLEIHESPCFKSLLAGKEKDPHSQ